MKPEIITPTQKQNWGLIIGMSIVSLLIIIMVINLTVHRTSRLYKLIGIKETQEVNLTWPWFCGVGVTLVVGGGLLWWLLQHPYPYKTESKLKQYQKQATHYSQQIKALLHHNHDQESPLLAQILHWQQTVDAVTRSLSELEAHDQLIQSDLRQLPKQINELEQLFNLETNTLLRADLTQMLNQRQQQLLALEQLQTARRRAEIQLERAMSVLATIYSQLLTCHSTFHIADYQHLADNVSEEVARLQDYLEALHEIKFI